MLFHRTGLRRFYQPVVGDLTLALEAPGLAADEGPRISACMAEPGSPSQGALESLGELGDDARPGRDGPFEGWTLTRRRQSRLPDPVTAPSSPVTAPWSCCVMGSAGLTILYSAG